MKSDNDAPSIMNMKSDNDALLHHNMHMHNKTTPKEKEITTSMHNKTITQRNIETQNQNLYENAQLKNVTIRFLTCIVGEHDEKTIYNNGKLQ
jgi:hypothetical protein